MKKVFLIGALALGMMSFTSDKAKEIEVVNCSEQASNFTAIEHRLNPFVSYYAMMDAYNEYFVQCVSLNG